MSDVNQSRGLGLQSLGVLHRQWMRADLMRTCADKELDHSSGEPKESELFITITVEPFGIYLFLWWALLFSVLEGCKEKGLDLSFLTSLDDALYESMRELRNTVFHTARGDRFLEDRMFNLMAQADAARRLRDIHFRLYDDFLTVEIKRRGLWTGDDSWGKRFPTQ
jgi:hypothetical protein